MSAGSKTALLLVASLVADGLPTPDRIKFAPKHVIDLDFETNVEHAAWRERLEGELVNEHVYQPTWREGEIRSISSLARHRGFRIHMSSWDPVDVPLSKTDAPLAAKVRAALDAELLEEIGATTS